MAATLVRVGFENDPTSVREVAYTPGMSFSFDVRPSDTRSTARLRVDLLRDNNIIAQGATPPIAWAAVGGQIVRVFVTPRDRAFAAPGGSMATGRADFALLDLGGEGVVAPTIAAGLGAAAPDEYFLPGHAQRPFSPTVREVFDGDSAVVRIPGAILLQREAESLLFTGNDNAGTVEINAERRLLRAPGVARTSSEESHLLGGKNSANVRSNRIDKVDRLGNITATADTLSTGRERPGVLTIRYSPTAAVSPVYFVFGGQDPQCMNCGSTEAWSPASAGRALSWGPTLDRRAGFAAVCIARGTTGTDTQTCNKLLVVGGYDTMTGALATDDLILDTSCITDGGECRINQARNLLTVRRRGLRAVLGFDGNRVVITGGTDAMDAPVYAMEVIDANDFVNLAQQELSTSNPASLALADGSVIIAGGLDRSSTLPAKNVWIIRGTASALPAATSR